MGKFRKDFIKEGYINFDYLEPNQRKVTKEELSLTTANVLNFDEEVGIE